MESTFGKFSKNRKIKMKNGLIKIVVIFPMINPKKQSELIKTKNKNHCWNLFESTFINSMK